MHKIGDLAKATGTKVVTVRYYEKIGLLPEPKRNAANYRTYDDHTLQRLQFIRRCRALGFSLDQVRELLVISSDTKQSCEEVDQLTSRHISDVEDKIAALKSLVAELHRIAASCEGGKTILDCRIIQAMSPAS